MNELVRIVEAFVGYVDCCLYVDDPVVNQYADEMRAALPAAKDEING